MNQFVGIQEAAKMLNVSTVTLKRWEAAGKINAHFTPGGHRRYEVAMLETFFSRVRETTDKNNSANGENSSTQ